jgi:hypothetical protein
MSKTTTKYNVNQIKQIIPLNENKVNFEVDFEVKTSTSLPFKAVVISEEDLNSDKPINYQNVTDGLINGNIKNDKGVYILYYLLLKADNPVDCDVTIDIKEVPLNPEIIKLHQQQINEENQNMINMQREKQLEIERNNIQIEKKRMQELQQKENERHEKGKKQLLKKVQEKEESKTNWLIIFAIIVATGIGIWFIFFNKKKNTSKLKTPVFKIENIEAPKLQIEVPKPEIEVPKLQIEVPKLQMEVPKLQMEVPKLDIEVPKLQMEAPKLEMEVPKLEMEVPKLEVEAPKLDILPKKNINLLSRLNNYFDN